MSEGCYFIFPIFQILAYSLCMHILPGMQWKSKLFPFVTTPHRRNTKHYNDNIVIQWFVMMLILIRITSWHLNFHSTPQHCHLHSYHLEFVALLILVRFQQHYNHWIRYCHYNVLYICGVELSEKGIFLVFWLKVEEWNNDVPPIQDTQAIVSFSYIAFTYQTSFNLISQGRS